MPWKSRITFYDLDLEVMQHGFHCILFFEMVKNACQVPDKGNIDHTPSSRMCNALEEHVSQKKKKY